MPPTRPVPAPEGVPTRGPTPGTTSSGLSASLPPGDPVSLLRCRRPRPGALPVGPFLSEDVPGLAAPAPEGAVAVSSVSCLSCVGRGLPGQGAIAGWSVVAPGRSVGARCGAVRLDGCDLSRCPRHLLFRARGHFWVGGGVLAWASSRWGASSAFPAEAEEVAAAKLSGALRLPARPRCRSLGSRRSPGFPASRRSLGWVPRTRSRDDVPPSVRRGSFARGRRCELVTRALREVPFPLPVSCLRIAPEVAGPVRDSVNHRPSQGFHHVKDRSEKSVPLGG
jgi:hypothetical protein